MSHGYFGGLEIRGIAHATEIREHEFHLVPTWNSLEFLCHGRSQLGFDGNYYSLEAPVMFWMPANHEFHWRPDKTQRPFCDHFYIDMTGPRSEGIIAALEESYPRHFTKSFDLEKTSALFYALLKYYRLDAKAYMPRIILTLEELMVMLHEHRNMGDKPKEDIFGICGMADRIKVDPFAELDFQKIAEEHNISCDYYRRLFKRAVRMPLLEYVRAQRMSYVAEMLRSTTLRVKEIATSCGFDDLASFSRAFRKYSGLSPREFRKERL